MKRFTFATLGVILAFMGQNACNQGADTTEKAATVAADAVKLEMYVMSQCPYGVQVENTVKPALDLLGDKVDFQLDFIVTETAPGQFNSLHGQPEVDGDIIQLCAKKLSPAKYMNFIMCQNKNAKDITNNWKPCATETGIDEAKLAACKDGDEGKNLLSESAKRATAANAKGSPTIVLAGKPYQGGRRSEDFTRAICNEFKAEKPAACANIPEPAVVNLTILTDKRCAECATTPPRLEKQLQGVFPGLKSTTVDYADEQGKALYAETKSQYLPVFLFDESIKKDEQGFNQLSRWLKPAGEKYQTLAVGAKFDPTAEICDNGADDTGDGKIDCDDPTCKENMLCRKEIKKRLDVFVMSQCPYGVKALNAMEEILKVFKGEIDFHVNYIAQEEGEGFKSLHGQPEVDENIRELCAIKSYSKDHKYMDYVLCRNKDIRSTEWEKCAVNGIKADVIKKCFEGAEGKKLLKENIKPANGMGIGASPTWLANNKYKFSGIDAKSIQTNFCEHNQDLKGCKATVSAQPAGTGGGGSCK